MILIQTISEMREWCKQQRKNRASVGFVPTMGYLHQGHLTLVERAKAENDKVVLSIFVNPLQFGLGEDYEVYPRDLTRDMELAGSIGVDVIFAPSISEMYPRGYQTFVDVENISQPLCGASRPGHFRGVATVVTKLFNIVQPNQAYFGQKDAQQVAVIRRMVEDINLDVIINEVEIVRETDGLAMSSRNVNLTPEQRKAALVLSKTLSLAQELVKLGECDVAMIKKAVNNFIESEELAKIDYVEILKLPNLDYSDIIESRSLLALAVRFGSTRLIDNTVLEVGYV